MGRHWLIAVTGLALATAAQAGVLRFHANFTPEGGDGRTGSGSVLATFDETTHDLRYQGSFTGLSTASTAAHFHCCTLVPFTGTAGVAVDVPSLPGFPLGVTAGSFDQTLDLDDPGNFQNGFLTGSGGTAAGATARLLAGFNDGSAYFNIHSSRFPGGEIRGFLQPVSEPASLAAALAALAALALARRRRA